MLDANRIRKGDRFVDVKTGEVVSVTRVMFAPLGVYVEYELVSAPRDTRRNTLSDFDSKFDPLI